MAKLLFSIAIALTLVPSALAGASFTDASGDVAYEGPTATPLPASSFTESLDLIGLEVLEEDLFFTFIFAVTGLAEASPTTIDYTTAFTWKDADFRLHITRTRADPTAPPVLDGRLEQGSNGLYTRILNLEATEESSAGTISVDLPKNAIISLEGHAPVYGSELNNVVTQAWTSAGAGDAGGRLQDQMPDETPGLIVYEKGGSANGHLTLEAPDPVRLSNGGATTFVFQAHLQNTGTEDDAATMTLVGAPEQWDVNVQAAQKVPAGDERPIFALVTIPFGHQHGGFTGFDLVATSSRDPSVTASIRFGVQHTPIPFPAGHHPTLYLHAASEDQGVVGNQLAGTINSMNTLEGEDDLPDALATVVGSTATWDIPLGPALGIGLDFALERVGDLALDVTPRRAGDATITAELLLVRGDDVLISLAEKMETTMPVDVQATSTVSFEIKPTAESDYIAYAPGQNMVLRIQMDTSPSAPLPGTTDTTPSIAVASFLMNLPLNEYADTPVWDEGIESSVGLVPVGETERDGKPGTTLVYKFTLSNKGSMADELELGIAGNAAMFADYEPKEKVRLGAGESREVSVAVKIPTDRTEGDRLEVILLARSETDPSNIALVRIGTTIASDSQNADESSEFGAAPKKSTPAPGAMVVLVVATIAMARRRP